MVTDLAVLPVSSFIHATNKHFLSTFYYVLGTVIGTGDKVMSKLEGEVSPLRSLRPSGCVR